MLASCGGDGSSREAWASQADAICRPALAKLRVVKKRIDATAAGGDPDVIFARSADLLREGAAISRGAFDSIEALDEPGEEADAADAWVASNRRQAALTDELAAAFDGQDDTRIARLSEAVDALEEANNARARRFGMSACAERVQP